MTERLEDQMYDGKKHMATATEPTTHPNAELRDAMYAKPNTSGISVVTAQIIDDPGYRRDRSVFLGHTPEDEEAYRADAAKAYAPLGGDVRLIREIEQRYSSYLVAQARRGADAMDADLPERRQRAFEETMQAARSVYGEDAARLVADAKAWVAEHPELQHRLSVGDAGSKREIVLGVVDFLRRRKTAGAR